MTGKALMGTGLPLALDPAGPDGAAVATLTWVMLWGAGAILLLVLAMISVALWGPERWRQSLGRERTIVWGGLVFPIVVLSILLVWGLSLTNAMGRPSNNPGNPLVIRITGERWWWRVDYPTFTTANEIVIPAGETVTLELISDNVIHSLWVPRITGKRDLIPGKTNRLPILAEQPGDYVGICAEYCGGPHALMLFRLIVLPQDRYALWAANQTRPPLPPRSPLARQGAFLFQTLGCGGCHRVAGTPATGLSGPDLSHVGSRRTIGSGILPRNAETLAAWTAYPHKLKPGNLMPAFSGLSPQELLALGIYMDGLE